MRGHASNFNNLAGIPKSSRHKQKALSLIENEAKQMVKDIKKPNCANDTSEETVECEPIDLGLYWYYFYPKEFEANQEKKQLINPCESGTR